MNHLKKIPQTKQEAFDRRAVGGDCDDDRRTREGVYSGMSSDRKKTGSRLIHRILSVKLSIAVSW